MSEVHSDILVLVTDLLLSSKVMGAAKAHNIPVNLVRDPKKLLGMTGKLLIVDLNFDGAIEAAGAWKIVNPESRVVGFVMHTDTTAIEAARSVGIDQVMARGAFFASIDQILSS